jgi:hypothetical protein
LVKLMGRHCGWIAALASIAAWLGGGSCKAIDETHQLVDSGYSGTVLFYLLGAIKIRKSPTRRNSVFLEFGR